MARSNWYGSSARIMLTTGPTTLSADRNLTVPGLALHKDPFHRWWNVTHDSSGLSVMSGLRSKAAGRKALEELGQLAVACGASWDVPDDQIRGNACLTAQISWWFSERAGLVGREYRGG